jgi:F-box protein 21
MENSSLRNLPDELLEAIIFYLPPADTLAFGKTCRACNKIAYEPLVWRRNCREKWHYWDDRHEFGEKLKAPPAQVKWRQLYNDRARTDKQALELFNVLLSTQQYRVKRMEEVARSGYDIKDLLLLQREETPDDVVDVLARRFHANTILGQLHRGTAIEKWTRVQKHQMVALEEVLGAYDLFVLTGKRGDLSDISRELDRLAECIRARDPDFDDLSTRVKAVRVAKWLRSEQLVGNPDEHDYHALRNNFISIALFDDIHTSLPLQSVAIYCAVARRLGVNAKPSNYPHHVHAVIEAPPNTTLDGRHIEEPKDDEPQSMHMDPWRNHEEVDREQLTLRLHQMGAPRAQHTFHLGPTSLLEVALRTGRNIMNSVQESRQNQQNVSRRALIPDVESAWYSMLWSMMILGDSNPAMTLHRRKQVLPYLIEHYQTHFPEDLTFIERSLVPMMAGEREHEVLMRIIVDARKGDENAKPRTPRGELTKMLDYKVGQYFQHKRYGYEGFIIGWDVRCNQEDRWIQQMRVDELPKGREQPFYHIVYVATPCFTFDSFAVD